MLLSFPVIEGAILKRLSIVGIQRLATNIAVTAVLVMNVAFARGMTHS
jgi:hypothetical protein